MKRISTKISLVVLTVAALTLAGCQTTPAPAASTEQSSQSSSTPVGVTLQDNGNTITGVMPDQIVDLSAVAGPVKEVTMTSFYGSVNGGPAHPQFSIKQITIKKGDQVKINVTNTNGFHNFNIDEYSVHQGTPPNQLVTVTFTADKAGKFIYYCSSPDHRANGHWGVLNVVE